MKGPRLDSVTLRDFRSISGKITVPLDADVVLIHGENGAGKTSILSAIEFGLTGEIPSLARIDSHYKRDITNKDASSSAVEVVIAIAETRNSWGGEYDRLGQGKSQVLAPALAGFFTDRCYLPQALLGQLIQIYQDSGTDRGSPLSRFVTELLGLDRLDAIELGLAPALDIRNLRKTADQYSLAERQKSDSEEHRTSLHLRLQPMDEEIHLLTTKASEIVGRLLDNAFFPEEAWRALTSAEEDERDLQQLHDRRRELASIAANVSPEASDAVEHERRLAVSHVAAEADLALWRRTHGVTYQQMRDAALAAELTYDASEDDPEGFVTQVQGQAAARRESAEERLALARLDAKRQAEIIARRERLARQIADIDVEIEALPADAGALARILAEISAHITGESCPVCDRDFAEVPSGQLGDHVASKVRRMSSAAERLLDLGRSRGELNSEDGKLSTEAEEIASRAISTDEIVALERRVGAIGSLTQRLAVFADIAADGSRLISVEAIARRSLAQYQHQSRVQLSVKDDLANFVTTHQLGVIGPLDTAAQIVDRIGGQLGQEQENIAHRMADRRALAELLDTIDKRKAARAELQRDVVDTAAEQRRVSDALRRASFIRREARRIEETVKKLRAQIIRREFNDRLNRLWRDLFVRLAPFEPFVPAFQIPDQVTRQLQPKLVTHHRDGPQGGSPGTMLSAGNLNTAALTLFTALHLTMKPALPWLILDDPVQSMDDVHIAHFASLLRTLSKQHERQVIIAVHDRQLFDYLKLELSPASDLETLLAIEIVKGRDGTQPPIVDRRSFVEDVALRSAA